MESAGNSDTERHPLPETLVYGGQAVIEGVMMRSPTHMAVAVRRPDGEIVLDKRPVVTFATRHKWARWPVIRGVFALIEAFSIGIAALNYSAEIAARAEAEEAEAEEEAGEGDADSDTEQGPVDSEPEADSVPPEGEPKRAIPAALTALSMVVSLAFGLSVFLLAPTWAAGYLVDAENSSTLANAVEGGIRLLLIVGYMTAISLWGPIRRVFEYHGAEHQVINAYEARGPLTVEAADAQTPLHRRCGTTFLVIVILLKIVAGIFVGWPANVLVRGLLRLALLIPVASLAYEVTRLAAKYPDNLLVRAMIAPGMWIQRITARRATPDMLAVSLQAFEAVQPESARTPVAQETAQAS